MQIPLERASFPFEVEWNLTWKCNAQCIFCSTAFLAREDSEDALFLADKIIESRPICVTLSGGEPLLHPSIAKIINIFKDAGIAVNITTNGILLTSKMMPSWLIKQTNWIRVSVHAGNPELARAIMGETYCLKDVLKNIAYIRQHTNRVSAFIVLNKFNADYLILRELLHRLSESGIKYVGIGIAWQTENMQYNEMIYASHMVVCRIFCKLGGPVIPHLNPYP